MPSPLFVVTTSRADPEVLESRAIEVAAQCGAVFVSRRQPIEETRQGAEWAYIVGHVREEMAHKDGRTFHVHAGLFGVKCQQGPRHPLIRLLAPTGGATRIVDATLGLAGDALHIAAITGATVVGCEASPPVQSLIEGGLARLKELKPERPVGIREAASRVELHRGLATAHLVTLADDSVDAVYVDPMMTRAALSQPGFDLFRAFARMDAFDDAFFEQALRVAPRVVVKTHPSEHTPPSRKFPFQLMHRKKAVAYWMSERVSSA